MSSSYAAIRAFLTAPDLRLQLAQQPAYSPDFNATVADWQWARQSHCRHVLPH